MDAIVALLILLLIIYITFSIWSGIALRAHEAQERDAALSRTLSAADYLMKEGFVHNEGSAFEELGIAHSHSLERGKLDSPDSASLAERAGLEELCVDLQKPGDSPGCSGYSLCIRRPVVIEETKEVGYLVVCSN